MPLAFASDHHTLEWSDGSQMNIPARYITEGTSRQATPGSEPAAYSNSRNCPNFHHPVTRPSTASTRHRPLLRSRPFDVLILNTLQVPKDIAPGEYVLGLRWDCEKSAQIWQSCADINIEA